MTGRTKILILLLMVPCVLGASNNSLIEEEQNDLMTLMSLVDEKPSGESQKVLDRCLDSKSWAVRATAVAILYKYDQNKYRKPLFEAYEIHTKSSKIPTQQNAVDYMHAMDVYREKGNTGYGTLDVRLVSLSVFEHFREDNKWFHTEKYGWLSSEAFFRTLFLTRILEGSGINVEELATDIDIEHGTINSSQ